MTGTYDCYRPSAVPPRTVAAFINNTTGRPAALDTAVSLTWTATELLVHAACDCGEEAVSLQDRLVVVFDPAGREADLLTVAVAPDAGVTCSQLGTAFPFTDPTWGAEPYAFPARAATRLTTTGWVVELHLPLVAMFALRGGVPPASFRLNVSRIFACREWSYWPLADGTWGESPFAFGLVRLHDTVAPPEAGQSPALPAATVAESGSRPLDGDLPNQEAGRSPALPERCADKAGADLRPLPFRGLMYDTSRGAKPYPAETYVQFVDWLAECGCTHFMLYFEDGFRYESHPQFAAANALTARDVQVINRACHDRGLKLMLGQTTFGHMYDVLRHPATIHLAEDGNPYQICPSHPETYRFLGELLDELIPLGSAEFFHVNCDESRLIGRCPRCRVKAPDVAGQEAVFLDHLLWLHAKVTAHRRRMVMWGDQLLGMPAVLERLPKDVVIADWHYVNWISYPTLSFFRDRGFDVIGAPAERYDNIRRMTEDCARRGALGVLDTIWEARDRHLGIICPGAYLLGRLAAGGYAQSDAEMLAEAEQRIWPDNPPNVPWPVFFDRRPGADTRLWAKLKADAAAAIRRATPGPRFSWLADLLRRDLENPAF